jgi:hypothetical protein
MNLSGPLEPRGEVTDIVVSRLMCGLGNQLFQYAAAVGLARLTGARVALDASEYLSGTQERGYMLDRYDLGVPVLNGCSFENDFGNAHLPAQRGLVSLGIEGDLVIPVYRQNNYEFEPAVPTLNGRRYLYGFWQSWKYFSGAAEELRARLITPRQPSRATGAMQSIEGSEAVAVHVRRGDYLSVYNQGVFGICESSYYEAAIALIREQVTHPRFFVFSDDPEWCRGQFVDGDMTIVSAPGGDAVDDLALMARCQHHVIANSSLSWWGAWLGERRNSIVASPFPWYTQSPRVRDLIPDRWIRLDRKTGATWPAGEATSAAPKVSVIVLARGGDAPLLRALNGVRVQSHPAFEIIVVLCGGVGERAISTAEEWAAQQGNARVVHAQGQSPGAALNAGVAQARGEWLAFADDCDVWRSDKLEIQIEAANAANAGAVSCRTTPVEGPSGKPTIFPPPGPPSCSLPRLLRTGYIISGISHVIVRKDVAQALGPFDDSWSPGKGVWPDLWNRDAVMLWERLVESPIPYVVRPECTLAARR